MRYLLAARSLRAVNVISIVATAGVAVATAAIICVLSVFNGFESLSAGRLALLDPELRVERTDGRAFVAADSLAAAVAALPEVKAALPTLTQRALAVYSDTQMPVTLTGVPEGYDTLSRLDDVLIDGIYALGDECGNPAAMPSVGVAVNLGIRGGFGSPMLLYAPKRVGRINPSNPLGAFKTDTVRIAGVWQIDQPEYDADRVFVPLERARGLFGYYDGEATSLELGVAPGVKTAAAQRAVAQLLGPEYAVRDRLGQQHEAFRMIAVEKWITFVMLAFILLIAAFNIISTLSMVIIEKRDDLHTLRMMGATPRATSRIFLWQGTLISLLGGAIGIVLGVVLALAQQYGRFIKLSGDPGQLSIDAYPCRLLGTDILAVGVLTLVVGLAVGMIASRLAPRQ